MDGFPKGDGFPEFFRHVFQGSHLGLGIALLGNGGNIGRYLVLLGQLGAVVPCFRRFGRPFLGFLHFFLGGKIPVGNGGPGMVYGAAHRAGLPVPELAGQNGGLAEDVVPAEGFCFRLRRLLDFPVRLRFGVQLLDFLCRLLHLVREPVHFPEGGAVGFGLRHPLGHFRHLLPVFIHVPLLFLQLRPLLGQHFDCSSPFFLLLFPAFHVLFHKTAVGADFFQAVEIACQFPGGTDRAEAFLRLFHVFFHGQKLFQPPFRFFQSFKMGEEYSRLLVGFSEISVRRVFHFPFFLLFFQETVIFFLLLLQILFVRRGGHGEGGGKLCGFRRLLFQKVIQGQAQFVLELAEPLGFEELL